MSTRKASTDVHEFEGMFLGFHVHFKVTSVIGHVFRLIFLSSLKQDRQEKALLDTISGYMM